MTLRNWQSVARKDFQDAVRSKSLLAITILFLLIVGGLTYALAFVFGQASGPTPGASLTSLLSGLSGGGSIFIPLLGLAVSYNSIAGERDTGQVKLLLSLPHTRTDVIVGKLLGRTAVMFIAIILGFALAAVIALVELGAFPPEIFLTYLALNLVYAFTFVAIGVSISAMTSSRGIAALLAIGLFALIQFVWGFIMSVIVYLTTDNPFFARGPEWAQFLRRLNPQNAFSATVRAAFDVIGPENPNAPPTPDVPIYLEDGVGMFILLLWIVVPLVLAYVTFTEADLT